MSATIISGAKVAAIRAVKRDMQAQGLNPAYLERQVIISAANAYLRDHPELIEQAAETIRKIPQLRTFAGHDERRRKRNQQRAMLHRL